MIKEYPLVILDEPTASLDPISEEKYIEAIHKSLNNSTVIMIAHRLSAVKKFDCIFVMDQGCIVEKGSHKVLMKRKGVYYNMFNNQARRYVEDE